MPVEQVGISLQAVDPPEEFVEIVGELEAGGFVDLWLADSSLHARYVHSLLTLAAVHSNRLRLGTNCTHPHTRHPALTANAMVTLHELSEGRAVLSLGAGDSPVQELERPISTLADLEAAIRLTRRLYQGERFDFEHPTFGMKDAGIHYGLDAWGAPPIYVTATGPKMLELGGRLADGVLVHCGASPGGLEFALERVAAGAREAGRTVDDLDVIWQIFGAVDDDHDAALAAARPMAAWFAKRAPRYCELAGADPELVGGIRAAYSGGEFHEARAAQEQTPDSLVEALTCVGSEAWRERLEQAAELGVAHVAVWPLGERRRLIRSVAKLIASLAS